MENTPLYKEMNNIPLADDDPQGGFHRWLTQFLSTALSFDYEHSDY